MLMLPSIGRIAQSTGQMFAVWVTMRTRFTQDRLFFQLVGIFNVGDFDSNNHSLSDYEYPDDYVVDDDWDEADVLPCPSCGAEIAEDSICCPICGEYITFSSSPWAGKSWWWVLVGLLGVVATVVALSLR